jgi:HEAT repeat protein
VVDVLVGALAHDDPLIRSSAADALGDRPHLDEQQTSAAADGLRFLLHDDQSRVRASAVCALGEIEQGDAGDSLSRMLSDESDAVRCAALHALSDFGGASDDAREPLQALLAHEDYFVRESAAVVLASLGVPVDPPDIDPLVSMLADESPAVRARAVWSIERAITDGDLPRPAAGPEVTEALVGLLVDPDAEVRAGAATALGELEGPAVGEGLVVALSDCEAGVRSAAAAALGTMRHEPALPALLRLLEDPDEGVRVSAASALVQMNDSDVGHSLAELMSTYSSRREAFFAVQHLLGVASGCGCAYMRCSTTNWIACQGQRGRCPWWAGSFRRQQGIWWRRWAARTLLSGLGAAWGLGLQMDKSAVPELVRALDDD